MTPLAHTLARTHSRRRWRPGGPSGKIPLWALRMVIRLVRCENIPALPASDCSVVRIYPL
eukprot:1008851-Prorocentrum_minimum.AAC.1